MRLLRILAMAWLALLARPAAVYPAAWPQPKGRVKVFLNGSVYRSKSSFDRNGNRENFRYNGRFSKYEINPYVEYGLTKNMTLVGSAFVPSLEYQDQYNRFKSFGIGDVETGARYTFLRTESMAMAAQGTVKFAPYDRKRQPAPGNGQTDYEARLLVGRSFHYRNFWNVEGAYRARTGYPANQVRLDATLGRHMNKRWMVLAQAFGLKSVGGYFLPVPGINPNIAPTFDLYKVQGSVVFDIQPGLSVQVGYTRDLYGRNVGAGQAILLSLWKEF